MHLAQPHPDQQAQRGAQTTAETRAPHPALQGEEEGGHIIELKLVSQCTVL